jgi:hypothetical protein
VSFGAPDQDSAGETLPPVQPKPFKTCNRPRVTPHLARKSFGLACVGVSLNAREFFGLAPTNAKRIGGKEALEKQTDLKAQPFGCRLD